MSVCVCVCVCVHSYEVIYFECCLRKLDIIYLTCLETCLLLLAPNVISVEKKKKKSNEELEKVKNDRSCCFFLPLSVFFFLRTTGRKLRKWKWRNHISH